MGYPYSDIAFTSEVREVQAQLGSREQYAFLDQISDSGDRFGDREKAFIKQADHFFQATVSASGWPYVQHRGGPTGFLKVIDDQTLGFADFVGNRQYLSVGNLKTDNRISLILMDYANQRRLKILGRARTVEVSDEPQLAKGLSVEGYNGRVERAFVIDVEGFDWNCPQHITPRFTEAEVGSMTAPLHSQVKRLKNQLSKIAKAELPTQLGRGTLALKITGVIQLTNDIRSYQLRDVNGGDLPLISAGAHLQIPVRLGDGTISTRLYSISSNPMQRDYFEISVLRQIDGKGGSISVHDDFHIGMHLNCDLPENKFELDDGLEPAVFIAGGIGITPIRSMLYKAKLSGRKFELHYVVKSRKDAAFIKELQTEFKDSVTVYATDENRRFVADELLKDRNGAQIYVCGPSRLMDSILTSAKTFGMPEKNVHYERFSAKAEGVGNANFSVTLARSGVVVNVPPDKSILEVVEEEGVKAAFSCRTGNCGMCAVKVLDGKPDHHDEVLTTEQREDESLICICVSRSNSESLVLDL